MARPRGSNTSSPAYQLHKKTGQARVKIAGKDHYLGEHGSPQSWEKYHRLLAESAFMGGVSPRATKAVITVNEVCAAFWEYASKRYADTDSHHRFRSVIQPLRAMYGTLPAADFSPLRLQAWRESVARSECKTGPKGQHLCRSTVNSMARSVTQIFRWAASRELVPGTVCHALAAVPSLSPGESAAREKEAPIDVSDDVVAATLPYLTPAVAAMVRLQRATGARPGEIVIMRGVDLDTSGAVWSYRPSKHKTQNRGKARVIKINADAQDVLRPFLRHDLTAFIFNPRETMVAMYSRNTKPSVGPKARIRDARRRRRKGLPTVGDRFGERYAVDSYRIAIRLGADRADAAAHAERPDVDPSVRLVPRWHPHQLRHAYATAADEQTGNNVSAVQRLLGHSSEAMTLRYIHRRDADLDDVAAKIVTKIG